MRKILIQLIAITATVGIWGCGGENTKSPVQAPGEEKTTKTKTLEVGSALMQDKTPIRKINLYLDGFHFYNGNMKSQMEAHHFCTKLNEDVTQCIIYDGNEENSKIMGVEYIISEKLFKTLPEEEKKLWHSHVYEVKSGELIAPGIPDIAEHELMEEIVSTYGKTFHTWHTDKDLELPMGTPQLMAGFTADGQLDSALLMARDKRFNVSTAEKRKQRADIASPPIVAGANAWDKGEIRQLIISKKASTQAHTHK